MDVNEKKSIRVFGLSRCALLIPILVVIIDFFLKQNNPFFDGIFSNVFLCVLVLSGSSGVFLMLWRAIRHFTQRLKYPFDVSLFILSPFLFLFFWRQQKVHITNYAPFVIVFTAVAALFIIFVYEKQTLAMVEKHSKALLVGFAIFYFLITTTLIIRQYTHFSSFNPLDFANYNQIFWNTIHGDIMHSSLYGSNFSCHNSPIYFLLVPAYALIAHPMTLMIIKTLLLTLCLLPLFLIAQDILGETPFVPVLIAFACFPYFISQHFGPPHEISYAPFFIFWAYYCYRKHFFLAFIIATLLVLCAKEHLVFTVFLFGLCALFEKRSRRWILVPIMLALAWALSSFFIIKHFQTIYAAAPSSSWLFTRIDAALSAPDQTLIERIVLLFKNANITNLYALKLMIPLFVGVGIIPPFLSITSLLGAPELLLNLIADRPDVLTPARHYNVVVSCFFFIATLHGIRKIAFSQIFKNKKIHPRLGVALCSIAILSLTLMYTNTWLWLAFSSHNTNYTKKAHTLLSRIPPDASVTVTKDFAPHVSKRKGYSILGQTRYLKKQTEFEPEYILIDITIDTIRNPQYFNKYQLIEKDPPLYLYKKR